MAAPGWDDVARELLDAAPDAVVVVDREGRIASVNRLTEAMFGYGEDELVGSSLEVLVPEALRERHRDHRRRYEEAPVTRPMGSGLELVAQRKDGTEIPVEISLSPLDRPEGRLVLASVRDITERVRQARELQQTQGELAVAEDRERIARDLHDTVIQELFATGMSLQSMAPRITEPEVADRIGQAVDALDDTIRRIRTVIFSLTHTEIPAVGVCAELSRLVDEQAAALGFAPQVEIVGPADEVSTDVAVHLLATVREALSNAARHASADAVSITVDVSHDELVLEVRDDGVGMTDQPSGGSGLRNMGDRAWALGGSCTVSRADPGGTLVEWRVPRPIRGNVGADRTQPGA